jgi:uncharacterized protein
MSVLEKFANQPYLNLETFRRNGEAMRTPVWFVQDGQKLYVRTMAESGKVKRVRNNPKVNVAVCEVDGRITGEWLAGIGREVRGEPEIELKVDQLLDVKYGEVKRDLARKAAQTGRKYTILEISIS